MSLVYMQHKPVKLQSVHHSMQKVVEIGLFKLGCFDCKIKQNQLQGAMSTSYMYTITRK